MFAGGSDGPALLRYLAQAKADLAALREAVERAAVPRTAAEARAWSGLLQQAWDLDARLTEAGAFVYCLMADDTADEAAARRYDETAQLEAELAELTTALAGQLLAMDDAVWEALIGLPELAPAAFYLAERRAEAAAKLPPATEALIECLAVDGLQAWESLRDGIVGRMRIEVPAGARPDAGPAPESLSPGQIANRLQTPDRAERQRLWPLWERAWAEQADLLADVLNRIVGFRLNVYRQRGWDDVLYEALQNNRMERQTLEAMWAGVASAAPALHRYLARKAELLGLPGLAWHDLAVPYSPGHPQPIGYAEGCRLIVDELRTVDPNLADFAQLAIEQRWIEAEDRPGKMAGAFAPDFPHSRQARIFMKYGGTIDSVTTLAHELGHGYHYWVMRDLPRPAQITAATSPRRHRRMPS